VAPVAGGGDAGQARRDDRRHAFGRLHERLEAEARHVALGAAFREEEGKRKAVSHMAKAVRGDVARALLLAKREPKTPGEIAAIAAEAGFEVELTPASLDVIVEA
jgi:cytoplasmic iron level regulating protein YaaA (DUF328/UPF0246 family)